MDYDIIFNNPDCIFILRHNNKIYRFEEADIQENMTYDRNFHTHRL